MQITSQQTEKVLKGKQTFSQFGFSMMVTRMRTLYDKDPSQNTITSCTAEINTFLTKFTRIMADDFAIIQGL